MTLSNATTHWQQRLYEHFDSLRKRNTSERPIFVLEHGLSADEVQQLFQDARTELAAVGLKSDHWLVWIVYATEYGYNFDGHAFWVEFTTDAPKWHYRDNRETLRNWFKRFQHDFGGIKPTGAWASHYNFITWPVTNAILPKDLQRCLAKSLYIGQIQISRVKDATFIEIGQELRRITKTGSTRFKQLLEQEQLIGQIVVSLLGSSQPITNSIDPETVRRIKDDLNKISDANFWLAQAKRTWTKSQIKSTSSVNTHSDSIKSLEEVGQESALRALNPQVDINFVIDRWKFELSIPLYSDIAAMNSEFHIFLNNTKVSVPLSDNVMHSPGWLLMGVRRLRLNSWPINGEPLLKFESVPPFKFYSDWNLHLRKPKVWVFKLNNATSGRMLWGGNLIAGTSYIFVTTPELDLTSIGEKQESNCEGVTLYLVKLPGVISKNLIEALKRIDLNCIKTVSINPIGIPPLKWDSEIEGVWLSHTKPMFRLKRDHSFDRYQITYGREVKDIEATAGEIIFEIPYLSSENNKLIIKTFENQTSEPVAQAQFIINFQDPKPWVATESLCPGIYVSCLPMNPTAHDFLSGDLRIEVQGENDVHTEINIVLKDNENDTIFKDKLMQQNLPISFEDWQRGLIKYLGLNEQAEQFFYFNTGYLEVYTNKSGSYRIPIEPHISPLNWIFSKKDGLSKIRLINQSVIEPDVSYATFQDPLTLVSLTLNDSHYNFTNKSGLVLAKIENCNASAIYAHSEAKDFNKFRLQFNELSLSDSKDYSHLTMLAQHWKSAKSSSLLASYWQKSLLKKLSLELIKKYCGPGWFYKEEKFDECPVKNQRILILLEGMVLEKQSIGYSIGRLRFESASPPELVMKNKLMTLFERHKFTKDRNAFEIAWKLAWFDKYFKPLNADELKEINKHKALLRAIRLMRLRYQYSTSLVYEELAK